VPAAIALEAVTKHYGSRKIIHELSFSVEPGEIVGFLGPNGAGKTTTMRMIAGFTTATTGTVRVAGFDMARQNSLAARHLGYLPEHPPLYEPLAVSSYLRFVGAVKGLPKARMSGELDRVLSACRLESVATREIYKLSKGYRQRVGLAQALLGDPAVLLLDEPTAGLDPGQIQETREVIRQAGQKSAVLLSTHILPEVTLICKRVAILNQGRLLAIDSPAGLQKASEQTSCVRLIVSGEIAALEAALMGIDGVTSVTIREEGPDSRRLAVECQTDVRDGIEADIAREVTGRWSLHQLQREQPTLENVFLRYIGGVQP